MPKPARYLLQLRLTDPDRRRIKSLAAKQGLTLQDAVVEAFDAWAKSLRAGSHDRGPKELATRKPEPAIASASKGWLTRAIRLDWSKCPEVELLTDGTNQLWALGGSDAPLTVVLGALAEGAPVSEIAGLRSGALTVIENRRVRGS